MLTKTQILAESSTAIVNAAVAFRNDVLNNIINIDMYLSSNFFEVFVEHYECKWFLNEDGDIIIDFLTEEKKSEFITRWSNMS